MRVDPQSTSFRAVFDAHADYVWRLLCHCGVPPRDREDLLQEIFLVVHRRLPEFEPRASLRTWLYAIVWRVVQGYRRKARRRPLALRAEVDPPSAGGDPESDVLRLESLRRLQRALAGLPEEQREVFLLFEVEQLPMKEIVAAMGTPLQTGYSRLRIARAHVRAVFAAEDIA